MRRPIGLVALLVLVLLGCGNQTTSPTAQLGSSHQVDLHRTGGLAGIDDQLNVTDLGQAQLVRAKPSHRSSLQLTKGELSQLHSQLDAADITKIPPNNTNPSARDAYHYTVNYQGHAITFDDMTVPPGLKPAFDTLIALLGRLSQ